LDEIRVPDSLFSHVFTNFTENVLMKSMGFDAIELWVIGYQRVWVMGRNFLHTISVTLKSYGVLESMGYQGYGLRGLRLYQQVGNIAIAVGGRCPQ
jgi:hypothetical protein